MTTLWGIDHGLEGAETFFVCLPVFKDGETFTRALSFQWGGGRGVAPIADDADLRDSCEPLELAEVVEVPEGSVVLAMGPRFAQHLASLDVTLETDWHLVQGGFRIAVLSWEAAEQRRRAYAERGRTVLTSEISDALHRKQAMRDADPVDLITPRAGAAHALVLNTAFLDPFEVAVLDLLVSKLLGDGGTAYSRLLLLHATSLRLDVERIGQSVDARLSHLMPPQDPATPGAPKVHRFDDAANVYQEIIHRFGDVTNVQVRNEVERASLNLGYALDILGRHEDALSMYGQLIAALEGRADVHAMEILARALFSKGTILRNQNKDADAIATYDQLLKQFSGSPNPAVQTQLLKATANKAASVANLGDDETAMAILEGIIQGYVESSNTEQLEAVAMAWAGKITAIARQGDNAKVVAEGDKMLERFFSAHEPHILRHVVGVFALKSIALDNLGRRDDALAALDALMSRVGDARAPMIADGVATALSLRTLYLRDMGRHDEARAARADLVRRFRGESGDLAQKAVANALVEDIKELITSERHKEALTVLDEFLAWFPGSSDPGVRKNFHVSLVTKGNLLLSLARYRDAVVSADKAYEQLTSASDMGTDALIPRVLNTAAFARLCLAKQIWQGGDEAGARALLEEAESRLQAALEHPPADPFVMGNAAYAAFLLGHADKARDLLTRAIALGGSKVREAELKDADICTLPQDDAFRELVRSIPDAPRAVTPSGGPPDT